MIRTPPKITENEKEKPLDTPPRLKETIEGEMLASDELNKTVTVRRSIQEIEARSLSPKKNVRTTRNKVRPVVILSPAEGKPLTHRPKQVADSSNTTSSSTKAFKNRTAEAKAVLMKAKMNLNNSKNTKTEIKIHVTEAIEKLYCLVKEAEEDREYHRYHGEHINTEESHKETMDPASFEVYIEHIKQNNIKMQALKETLDRHHETMERNTYASVVVKGSRKIPEERVNLHSVVITSRNENDSGEVVLDKVRKVIDAKEGWIQVDRVRKAKDRKIVLSCRNENDRKKIRERIEETGDQLVAEDIRNKDPLLVLRDVLTINSDEDVLKALTNQNKDLFSDLQHGEDRLQIKYRKRARNIHTNHVVISTSPTIWNRAISAGTVRIDLQRIRVADQSPLTQCTRCLGYGHSKRFCKETVDLCSHCGGPHQRSHCSDHQTGKVPSCVNCERAKVATKNHNAFSEECTVRGKWDALARLSVAYC